MAKGLQIEQILFDYECSFSACTERALNPPGACCAQHKSCCGLSDRIFFQITCHASNLPWGHLWHNLGLVQQQGELHLPSNTF